MRIASVFLVLILVLGIRAFLEYQNRQDLKDGEEVNFVTQIKSQPKISGSRQIVSANLDLNRILIITSPHPEFNYQDRIRVSGKLKVGVLNKNEIFILSFPKIQKIEDENSIFKFISVLRQKLIYLFERTLPSDYSSLLLGIAFGIRRNMSSEFLDNLRIAGVLHVIAASGMNITLFGGFIGGVFSFFLKRQIALFLTVSGVLFYAVLSGFEASIVRATIMGILALSAQILGRQRLSFYALMVAGYLMIFINPLTIFDIGFQLSFAATFGLLSIRPFFFFSDTIKKALNITLIGEDLIITLSAQAATLPILIANFGTYSIWSVFVNALVLWTVPILMVIGAVGGSLGIFWELAGKAVILLAFPLIFYFDKIVSLFSDLGGSLEIEDFPWQFAAGYYLILVSLVLKFKNKL
ncbi:MAG: hypothetical protein A2958_00180 [Candidatus Levybacteria bacterium RIFCSPLOWO2_01_FULL_38_13]|nr:MAG: hypothetical protein A2629_02265 [Candidatus Levybacteria bacterium RIFCSPHIGHO2_01_FULL_41_15]OGH34957.1 MAG: hypothetical protein A2958_00180 [Candidatus Levybacteria bacterium RIFCSPLOWO2_01_FULL_38_13]